MPKQLTLYPVHLGLGATAVTLPRFEGDDWFEKYGELHGSDGREGRLVSLFSFEASWTSWERHPAGSEVVICIAGEITLIQELAGEHVRTTLKAGEYAINEPGVWHTADVEKFASAVFITAGLGTEHRPR